MGEIFGGPYPLAVGLVPPSQCKVWFDEGVGYLRVWNFATLEWQAVLTSVVVGMLPPANPSLGQPWLDGEQKLWVRADDWVELTEPILGASFLPLVANGATLFVSEVPPIMSLGELWYNPRREELFYWGGFLIKIGGPVRRRVRVCHPAVPTWNAGGFRTQAVAAGDFLFVAGMRGIDPATQQQVPGPGPGGVGGSGDGGLGRFRQVYRNIRAICQSEGISLFECCHLSSTTTSPVYINLLQATQSEGEFWGDGVYPPRTVSVVAAMSGSDTEVEMTGGFARGDILEVQAIFWRGHDCRIVDRGMVGFSLRD